MAIPHDCSSGVVGAGNVNSKVVFVGIAPGRHEWEYSKKPFTGPSGKLFDGLLKFVGLQREDVWATNLICWWKDNPTLEEIEACRPRLLAELRAIQPKLIVAMGTLATAALLGRPFSQAQGGVWRSDTLNCYILSTYHPAAYLRAGKSEFRVDIATGVRDFRKVPMVLDWPNGYEPAWINWAAVDNIADANDWLEHLVQMDNGRIVAVDVETKYDGSEMISIAFACTHGVIHFPRSVMQARPDWTILPRAGCEWTFHNGQFDTEQIRKHLGVSLPIVEDTMLMSYSLDERGGQGDETDSGGSKRAVGIHGLKGLAREYLAAGFYSGAGKPEDMTPEQLAEYNSKDAGYTYKLAQLFIPRQNEDNVRDMYLKLLIPAANVLSEAHERGAYIDLRALRELALEWIPEWMAKQDELTEKAKALGWDKDELNTNSAPQLSRFIYDICGHRPIGKGKQARSTAMAFLKVIETEGTPLSEWCALLREWRGLDHDISNYITVIENELLKDPKRHIHPECLIHGARNGRFAYHNPPVQTIPKPRTVGEERARIRRIFAVRKGRTMIEADFRQAELWTCTMVTGDKQMLEDLRTGDFHARVAEASFGVTKAEVDPLRWELLRDSSKILVYGKLYGAGVDALMGDKAIQGRGSTGSYVLFKTKAEAYNHVNNFDKRYHTYAEWREAEKQRVMADGEQQSATGRKRRYFYIQDYKQLNQAINMPISSLSHDHIIMSFIELRPLLAEFDCWLLWDVHDSLVYDCPTKYVNEVVPIIKRVMERPKFGFEYGIPVDVKVGQNWFDLHTYKEADFEVGSVT